MRNYHPTDFVRTEELLDKVTKRLHAVTAQNDPATLDALQRLIVIYDLFKQIVLADPLADAGGLYPFEGESPAEAGYDALRVAIANVHEHAKPYTHFAADLDQLLNSLFEAFGEDFGPRQAL